MTWRKYARLTLLLVAFVMLVYQSHTAFNLLIAPPMIVTTSETNISGVRKPLVYLCPSDQYDSKKMLDFGYNNKWMLVFGMSSNKSFGRTWGAHLNKTWEQLIRNILKVSPEEFMNNTERR